MACAAGRPRPPTRDRLRPPVPRCAVHRRLHQRAAGRDGHERDRRGPDPRHPLPGAGAGGERRGRGRVVGPGDGARLGQQSPGLRGPLRCRGGLRPGGLRGRRRFGVRLFRGDGPGCGRLRALHARRGGRGLVRDRGRRCAPLRGCARLRDPRQRGEHERLRGDRHRHRRERRACSERVRRRHGDGPRRRRAAGLLGPRCVRGAGERNRGGHGDGGGPGRRGGRHRLHPRRSGRGAVRHIRHRRDHLQGRARLRDPRQRGEYQHLRGDGDRHRRGQRLDRGAGLHRDGDGCGRAAGLRGADGAGGAGERDGGGFGRGRAGRGRHRVLHARRRGCGAVRDRGRRRAQLPEPARLRDPRQRGEHQHLRGDGDRHRRGGRAGRDAGLHGDGDGRAGGAGQAGRAVPGAGDCRQPRVPVAGPGEHGTADRGLRRRVPRGGGQRSLHRREPCRDRDDGDACRPGIGHRLRGAGARVQRRGGERMVGRGAGHHHRQRSTCLRRRKVNGGDFGERAVDGPGRRQPTRTPRTR